MSELDLTVRALPPARRHNDWRDLVTRGTSGEVDVALVGKYGLEDAYISIHESLKHAGLECGVEVNSTWVHAEEVADGNDETLHDVDGIVVPGGFGARGTLGKVEAIRFARERDVPFLGLCLGFQMAVVEYARNVLGLEGAHSAEIDPEADNPVIDLLPEQADVDDMGGTMRLGAHETAVEPGSLAAELYGEEVCVERHRHRYEVNPDYIDDLEDAGLRFSGRSGPRMEILELSDHPYFLGTQFHPEFRSRPGRASPPFVGFLEAVLDVAGIEGGRDEDVGEVEV